jgi:hypothetical protein
MCFIQDRNRGNVDVALVIEHIDCILKQIQLKPSTLQRNMCGDAVGDIFNSLKQPMSHLHY